MHRLRTALLPDLVTLLNNTSSMYFRDKIHHDQLKRALMDIIVVKLCAGMPLKNRKIIPPTVCQDAHAPAYVGHVRVCLRKFAGGQGGGSDPRVTSRRLE